MYGKAQYSSVNKLKDNLFLQKNQGTSGQVLGALVGMNLNLLPRCRASFNMHVERANYQTYIWGHTHKQLPNVPRPEGHGRKINAEGAI